MIVACALALLGAACAHRESGGTVFDPLSPSAGASHWRLADVILQRIRPPEFPSRSFLITDYGAVSDGLTDCNEAFRAAIRACGESRGGRVVVPPGKFLTGPIHLRSRVELHLEEGAEVIFSDRFEDYLPPVFVRVGGVELFNYSPLIYATNATDIAITGRGRLNGNARAWWDWKSRETREFFAMAARGVPVEQRVFGTTNAAIRPSFVSFIHCTNILFQDFTIGSGPNWTLHPIYSQNITFRGVQIQTDGPNNDGIDVDSCRDVLIEHCTFDTGDDCVVLKSGYNEDGWRVGRPTENVIMRYCSSKRGHGGLVIGSEMSGDVRNVFMHDCEFEGTDRAVRIKSRVDRGGVVENIFARNLKLRNMKYEAVIMNMDYTADRNQPLKQKPPLYRNMVISDVECDGVQAAIRLTGLPDSPIQRIRFENMSIRSIRGVLCKDVQDIVFENAQVAPQQGPVFSLTNAANVVVQRCTAPQGTDVFLQLAGANSQVMIQECDLSGANRAVVSLGEMRGDSVEIRSLPEP